MVISTNGHNDKYGFENPFSPDPLAIKSLNFIKSSKNLLDVGCGEGADSIFYANHGFQVDALDTNALYLNRLKAYQKDHKLSNIFIKNCDVINYDYPKNYYDVVNCILVGCCMRKSEFEKMLIAIKQTIKPNGVIIMSLRNYLDPEFVEYSATEAMIEPNTYIKKDVCCKIRYYIEKGRLKVLFEDFEILYYYEGLAPDKYEEVETHGDTYIICRRKMESNVETVLPI